MSLGDIHSHSSIVTSAQRRQKLELFGVKHITVKMSLWPMERQVTMKLSLLYWLSLCDENSHVTHCFGCGDAQ
jgi:proteasome lid subunit RPN8/RPN11